MCNHIEIVLCCSFYDANYQRYFSAVLNFDACLRYIINVITGVLKYELYVHELIQRYIPRIIIMIINNDNNDNTRMNIIRRTRLSRLYTFPLF